MADQQTSFKKDELENSILLRGVEFQSIRGLLEDCSVRRLKRGEALIEAGQPNHFLYVLLAGRLSVRLQPMLDPIAILGPGEIAGELSLIDGQLTSAYVIAEDDCRVLALDEKKMWSLVYSCPTVALNLLFVLAQRLRHGNSLILTGQQLEREYTHYAVIDALTGLYNRRWLDNMLPREMEHSRRGKQVLSLLLIKIDDFKAYTESHGHLAGECALYTVARAIRAGIHPNEMTARYGENKFIALLPAADTSISLETITRLRQSVSVSKIVTTNEEFVPSVTISVGAAQMTAEDTPGTFISTADRALYDARNEG